MVGSKHTVDFAWDKIEGVDIVGSINHVTFLTNRFSKLISLPMSTIFVSGTSESVFYFLEFSCITAILKIQGVCRTCLKTLVNRKTQTLKTLHPATTGYETLYNHDLPSQLKGKKGINVIYIINRARLSKVIRLK